MTLHNEADIINMISSDKWMMEILRTVRALSLPDWCICAGFVRSRVWDIQHGYKYQTPLPDVDVVYYNRAGKDEFADNQIEKRLDKICSAVPWSVKNQARMHTRNCDSPYLSTVDALAKFPETATAVGVCLDASDHIIVVAPYGIEDLIHLLVQPTPYFVEHSDTKMKIYETRLYEKNWKERWHRLQFIHML